MSTTKAKGGSGETLRQMNRRHAREFKQEIEAGHYQHAKNDSTIIQCAECDNQVSVDQFTGQELREDGWLLEPVVYCPKHGPDDDDKGERR